MAHEPVPAEDNVMSQACEPRSLTDTVPVGVPTPSETEATVIETVIDWPTAGLGERLLESPHRTGRDVAESVTSRPPGPVTASSRSRRERPIVSRGSGSGRPPLLRQAVSHSIPRGDVRLLEHSAERYREHEWQDQPGASRPQHDMDGLQRCRTSRDPRTPG